MCGATRTQHLRRHHLGLRRRRDVAADHPHGASLGLPPTALHTLQERAGATARSHACTMHRARPAVCAHSESTRVAHQRLRGAGERGSGTLREVPAATATSSAPRLRLHGSGWPLQCLRGAAGGHGALREAPATRHAPPGACLWLRGASECSAADCDQHAAPRACGTQAHVDYAPLCACHTGSSGPRHAPRPSRRPRHAR